MSTTEKTFYGIRCDFPDCGEDFEGYEYSYWYDPGAGADEARDSNWLTDFEGHDYCPAHVIQALDEDEQDEDDHYGLRPMEDTIENRLAVILKRVADMAESRARSAQRRIENATSKGHWGTWGAIDAAMIQAFERAVRAVRPDITGQQLFDMRVGKR